MLYKLVSTEGSKIMTKLRVRLPEIKLSEEVSRKIGMTGLKLRAASPELLVGVGIAGVIVSAAIACKATLKAEAVMKETKETLDKIEECKETVDSEKYSEADYKKDLRLVYLQTCVKMAKIYAPAAIIGVMSITCILAGHDILKKRNIAINAAYSAAAKSFSDYSERVREELGEDADRRFRYNIKKKETEVTEINENGEEVTVKKEADTSDYDGRSGTARWMDDCKNVDGKDLEYKLWKIKCYETTCNQLLRSRGYLFLNEVYEALGLPITSDGQILGWIYNDRCPNGDNYVDFGLQEVMRDGDSETSYLLDFNIDGNILNEI